MSNEILAGIFILLNLLVINNIIVIKHLNK